VKVSHVCTFVLLTALTAFARIINVPEEYATIQAGIDASVNGDTVLVAAGEYIENPIIQDKNLSLISAEGPDATHINGHLSILGYSVDSTCVLRGFRISKSVEAPWLNFNSLVYVQFGSPLILANKLEGYSTTANGAGVRLDTSGAIIRGNIISNNWSYTFGGGIWASGQRVIIEGNIITGNKAGYLPDQGDFAGIGASGIIRYNLISGNIAGRVIYHARGGGIIASINRTQIYNNTIVGNSAYGQGGHGMGGGLLISSSGSNGDGFVKNNIIAFNPNGSGVYAEIGDSAYWVWDYNLVFGNDSADYVGFQPGPNDIQADPMFIDRYLGDYHLLGNSPCIDAGDPSFPLDSDSTRADIGAYYFDHSVGIDGNDIPSGPYQFTLKQNYPNPFNAQTVILYNLDKQSTVSLHIYSVMGHLIMPLVNKEIQKAGEHQYIWEGRDAKGNVVTTGVYFYELYVNDSRESKAMILIK
jgi:hypothetical protein